LRENALTNITLAVVLPDFCGQIRSRGGCHL